MPGGPEHIIAVLADHNLGVAKDLLVVSPGRVVLNQIRSSVETDPEGMTWFGEMDPGAMRARGHRIPARHGHRCRPTG